MILIPSASYVGQDLSAELGLLPSAFVPVANRRLYEHQLDLLRALAVPGERMVLSIPEGFVPTPHDLDLLRRLGCTTIEIDPTLKLAASIAHALDAVSDDHMPLTILHGDTLVDCMAAEPDVLGVGLASTEHRWDTDPRTTGRAGRSEELVWNGYFRFSNPAHLKRLLLETNDFAAAVLAYDREIPMARVVFRGWLDFGHVSTYFLARSTMSTSRVFNTLSSDGVTIEKSSHDVEKIRSEAQWYRLLPSAVRVAAPQLVSYTEDRGSARYRLEYLPCIPLNELFVHGRRSDGGWARISRLCTDLLRHMREATTEVDEQVGPAHLADVRSLILEKTHVRVAAYCEASGIDPDRCLRVDGEQVTSLAAMVESCAERVLAGDPIWAVLHGDFCFSNLLLDSRLGTLRMVDPRGVCDGRILGDQRYDAAKLLHSACGSYDSVVAGAFEARVQDGDFELVLTDESATKSTCEVFRDDLERQGFVLAEIDALVVLLFISMLPLHHDRPDRQVAFLAIALRYYRTWVLGVSP